MTKPLTKAVFPVAGLGTRFLPATKASPKEMLPVVDKPIIQYAVEEAVAAGIKDLIFVTGRTKRSIEDHFDKAVELEAELEARGKAQLLDSVRSIVPDDVSCIYIRQSEPLGLGHAVLCAKPAIGNEPFAVILPDDLIDNDAGKGCIAQMVDGFAAHQCSILAVQKVNKEDTEKYGIVSVSDDDEAMSQIKSIVEKPPPSEAPSTLAVVGRYVLTPGVLDELERTGRGAGGEIQLTDAIASLVAKETVMSLQFAGDRFDCGSKLGFLQATVELALKHPDIGESFRAYLDQR